MHSLYPNSWNKICLFADERHLKHVEVNYIYIYTGPNIIVIHQFSELARSITANETKYRWSPCGCFQIVLYRCIISHHQSTMKILGKQTKSPRLKQNENYRMANPMSLIGAKPKHSKKECTCLMAPTKGTLPRSFRGMLRNTFVPVNNIPLFKLLIHYRLWAVLVQSWTIKKHNHCKEK